MLRDLHDVNEIHTYADLFTWWQLEKTTGVCPFHVASGHLICNISFCLSILGVGGGDGHFIQCIVWCASNEAL